MSKNKNLGDMPAEEFKKYGYELVNWAANYLENVESFPVLPNIKPGDIKAQLPKSAPAENETMEKIIADIDKIILPSTTHWQHPNFMAYFNSTASGPGILGELLSAAFNVNAMVWKSAPASTELEETVLIWFRQLMNLPEQFKGIIYDTASVSSMHAIAAARESVGYDIRKKGMSGAPRLSLYCSEHAHSSIDKGALTLGIGLEGIRKIRTDPEFRMIPAELEKAIDTGQLHKYHFNFLRNILEKTSTFLGYDKWGDLLPKTDDGRPNPYEARVINISSHSKFSGEEVTDITEDDKRVLRYLVGQVNELYRFKSNAS